MSGTDDPVLEHQLRMNRETWSVLGQHGVRDGAELSLEFLFFAPGEREARALAAHIDARTDCEATASSSKAGLVSRRRWVVEGSTRPAPVTLAVIDEWVTWLVAAGAAHNCEFDGWGAFLPEG